MYNCRKAQHIAKCLQLAITLEVSTPKPGNVSFNANFEGTRVDHFLASAIAAGTAFQEAAYRGILVFENKLELGKVGIGELIKNCAADVAVWQKGGNTILGTIMLLVPIAVAAGMLPTRKKSVLDFLLLRKNIDAVVRETTAIDSVNLYRAVSIANPSGLGDTPNLDLNDPKSIQRLLDENIGLFEVFQIAASYDDICYEWVNNYPITFNIAYPYLRDHLNPKSQNTAITHTFLKILAARPDTFIARKVSKEKALQVSTEANDVLEAGGLDTSEGKRLFDEFDKKLRSNGNKSNPGTTADLTAAALALCTLDGYRP